MRVLILAAITVDGRIARGDAEFTGWSSREDKRLFARTSREAGVVVMGRRTFETLPAPLPGRLNVVLSHERPATLPDGVEYTAEPPEQVIASLAQRGFESVVIGGGASVYRAFLEAKLVDELWLTVEPLTFGAGISLLGDAPLDLRLSLLSVERLGEGERSPALSGGEDLTCRRLAVETAPGGVPPRCPPARTSRIRRLCETCAGRSCGQRPTGANSFASYAASLAPPPLWGRGLGGEVNVCQTTKKIAAPTLSFASSSLARLLAQAREALLAHGARHETQRGATRSLNGVALTWTDPERDMRSGLEWTAKRSPGICASSWKSARRTIRRGWPGMARWSSPIPMRRARVSGTAAGATSRRCWRRSAQEGLTLEGMRVSSGDVRGGAGDAGRAAAPPTVLSLLALYPPMLLAHWQEHPDLLAGTLGQWRRDILADAIADIAATPASRRAVVSSFTYPQLEDQLQPRMGMPPYQLFQFLPGERRYATQLDSRASLAGCGWWRAAGLLPRPCLAARGHRTNGTPSGPDHRRGA